MSIFISRKPLNRLKRGAAKAFNKIKPLISRVKRLAVSTAFTLSFSVATFACADDTKVCQFVEVFQEPKDTNPRSCQPYLMIDGQRVLVSLDQLDEGKTQTLDLPLVISHVDQIDPSAEEFINGESPDVRFKITTTQIEVFCVDADGSKKLADFDADTNQVVVVNFGTLIRDSNLGLGAKDTGCELSPIAISESQVEFQAYPCIFNPNQ